LKPLRIGTRASALALWQAEHVSRRLAELHGVTPEIVRIRTTGDRLQSASLAQINAQTGSKGLFIKEIEDALLSGAVDIAVHSMKDVPAEVPAGLAFPVVPERADPRDCLISREGRKFADLAPHARVGTSSLRRQAQLRHHRPDLDLVEIRGNVDTRIKKAEAGEFDAVVLALAGVSRLGLAAKITEVLSTEIMLPAVGQGALGLETRAEDSETIRLVSALDHAATHSAILAERALLRELEGGCQVPLGAWARLENETLRLEACVFSPDGREFVRREISGPACDAGSLGLSLGTILIEAGADRILRLVRHPLEN
jgi:hydroxymethylbilane synthase